MLGGSPVIGAQLLQHLVEEIGTGGRPLGVLLFRHSDKSVLLPTLLPLLTLLLLLGVSGT